MAHVDASFVDELAHITPLSLGEHVDLQKLKAELPAYQAAAAGATFDGDGVTDYSEAVLQWWACNRHKIPEWAAAARIIFAISPNSASCERVFSLLEHMFGDHMDAALSDYIESALMLRYHKRRVG